MTTGIRSISYLGGKARFLRVLRLLTQKDLAEMAGVSPAEVNLLESGQLLDPEAAQRLLRELGLPAPY